MCEFLNRTKKVAAQRGVKLRFYCSPDHRSLCSGVPEDCTELAVSGEVPLSGAVETGEDRLYFRLQAHYDLARQLNSSQQG